MDAIIWAELCVLEKIGLNFVGLGKIWANMWDKIWDAL